MITIKRANNGLIVIDDEVHDDGRESIDVFQDATENLDKFMEFLYHLNDILGPSTSRYSKERIQVSLVEGDKYSDGKEEVDE